MFWIRCHNQAAIEISWTGGPTYCLEGYCTGGYCTGGYCIGKICLKWKRMSLVDKLMVCLSFCQINFRFWFLQFQKSKIHQQKQNLNLNLAYFSISMTFSFLKRIWWQKKIKSISTFQKIHIEKIHIPLLLRMSKIEQKIFCRLFSKNLFFF